MTRAYSKNNLRYGIWSEEIEDCIDYRSNISDALNRAQELLTKYTTVSIVETSSGRIIRELARNEFVDVPENKLLEVDYIGR